MECDLSIWLIILLGFGFLTFESEEAVNNLVAEHYVTINGKKVTQFNL